VIRASGQPAPPDYADLLNVLLIIIKSKRRIIRRPKNG